MSSSSDRPQRRDAAQNRDRLVDAAREVFARLGHEAPLEEVARAADVSRTTLYRHFATREHLALVIFEDNVARIEERAAQLRDAPGGLRQLVDFILDMQYENRSMWVVLSGADLDWLTALNARTVAAVSTLAETARAESLLHDDVGVGEVMLAFPMAAGALGDVRGAEHTRDQVRGMVHRALFRRS